MPLITKTYTTSISDTQTTIFASSVIEAFDTIYDVINGNLDSANIKSTLTVLSSNVTISTDSNSFYSAVKASDIVQEYTHKGWNTVHCVGFGTAGFSVFPGYVEVNGRYCRVDDRINFEGFRDIRFQTSASSHVWIFTVPSFPTINKSDCLLIEYTGTNTVSYDADKNGYYYGSDRRALFTLRVFGLYNSALDSYWDDEYIQRPSVGFSYPFKTTSTSVGAANPEIAHVGFDVISTVNRVCQVLQIFDMETNRYYYDVHAVAPSAINTTKNYQTPLQQVFDTGTNEVSAGLQHHMLIDDIQIISCQGGVSYYEGGTNIVRGSQAGTATSPLLRIQYVNSALAVSTFSRTDVLNSNFRFKIRRRPDTLRRF